MAINFFRLLSDKFGVGYGIGYLVAGYVISQLGILNTNAYTRIVMLQAP